MSQWGYRFIRFLIRVVLRLVTRMEVHGIEQVPPSGGCILVSNHLGRLDPALVYFYLERTDVVVLVAEKYQKVPLLPWVVRQLNGMFIDRFNPDFSTLREAISRLKAGCVLVLAPEGTRSKTEALQEGRFGAAFIAAHTGAQVIPVAITGTEDRQVKENLRRLRRSDVVLRAGEPFVLLPVKGKDREVTLAGYTDEIMCRLAALLPPRYRGIYAEHPRLKELLSQGSS